jgi:hypothetical protein
MNGQTIFRAMAATVIMLAASAGAQAQLGGAVNRARQAVQQQTQTQQQSAPAQPTVAILLLKPPNRWIINRNHIF